MTAGPLVVVGVGSPTRTCVACGRTFPHTSEYFRGRWDLSLCKLRFSTRCKECDKRNRQTRAKTLAKLRADDLVPPPQKPNESLFDAVIRDLEKLYGPYAKWPREAHLEHSRRLQKATGKEIDPAPVRPVFRLDPSDPRFRR